MNNKNEKIKIFKNIGIRQILSYHLPLAGKLSIMHRISGIFLFIFFPLLVLPVFSEIVKSKSNFEELILLMNFKINKIIFIIITWSYLHHFFSGIRYLLIDIGIFAEKNSSKKTAMVVFVSNLIIILLLSIKIF